MIDGDARDSTEVAVFSLIERGLATLGCPGKPEQIRRLTALVAVLAAWAPRINLTGHRDPLEMTSRLVLDAVALALAVPELKTATRLADLGSGAGFPGLPIAILNPHLHVYLVDSRRKRNHFQREARRRLGLPRVHPILGRSEAGDPVRCDVVVAQAMSSPAQAIEWMIPWARPGGLLVLPASEGSPAPDFPETVEAIDSRSYRVPETGTRRRLQLAKVSTRVAKVSTRGEN